ncbi:MAG: hypothetical protein EGS63_12655 [Lachnospira sp.]|nr:hypothetical protein [Lachnospira sp.]
MSKLIIIKGIIITLIVSVIIFSLSVNTACIVKADTQEQTTQAVQEVSTLPSTEDDVEKMSVTDKLLLLILVILCLFFGSFVGYVVIDRLR